MKRIILNGALAALMLPALSCGSEERIPQEGAGMPATFHIAGTRAADYPAADYFAVSADATVVMGFSTGTYTYANDVLEPKNPAEVDNFRFPLDGSGVNITVSWPVGYAGPKADQSAKANFLLSDALRDVMTGVAPTTHTVPVYFGHVNSLITFVCSDASLRITALTIGGYTAWCDPLLNAAQLILAPATASAVIAAGAAGSAVITDGTTTSTKSFKLGTVPVGTDYTAGSNHTITLTLAL